MEPTERLLERAERLLERLEHLLPAPVGTPDWTGCQAARWRREGARGWLEPVTRPARSRLADLLCIERQKTAITLNTRQFLAGLPANNCLLWGPRGTGKSSLIKAVLNEFAPEGLRLVEVGRERLADLPEVMRALAGAPRRFLVFCDDLSFEREDPGYKSLKAALDGSIDATPDNVLVYATSNRRHLLPERLADNLEARNVEGEIHHSEAVEERISLSERFGLWLSFHPFTQEQYLEVVEGWLARLGAGGLEAARPAALQWALEHGSRSGRSAWQFAKDWAGRQALGGGATG